MRLIEKCSCGASIEIIWDETAYYRKGEEKRATEELGIWRRAHANCSVSNQERQPE